MKLDLKQILVVCLLIGLTFLLQISLSPANHKIHSDGTVFAYAGMRILDGDIPYKDFWDHKTPGVYYLNALAFLITGVDAWSVWFLTLVWSILIVFAFFITLLEVVPFGIAGIFSGVFISTLLLARFNEGPNLTEFYGILPAILALYFSYKYLARHRPASLIGLGASFAIGFLFKQTAIATSLVCIVALTWIAYLKKGLREAAKNIAVVAAPIVAILLVILYYWGKHEALVDLWQATISYNFLYTGGSPSIKDFYRVFRTVAADESLAPLAILAAGGGVSIALSLWTRERKQKKSAVQASEGNPVEYIYFISFISLLFEIAFVSIGGRNFGHYYLSLIPALCFSATYFFRSRSPIWQANKPDRSSFRQLSVLSIACLGVWFLVTFGWIRPSMSQIQAFLMGAPQRKPLRTNIGKFINKNTLPKETVLYWNIGAELNFETQRRSPSRYIYFRPLFTRGFQNEMRWNEFLDDLATNQPALIITQRGTGYAPDFDVPVEELAASCQCDGEILEGFTRFSLFVRENYTRNLMFDEKFAVFSPTRKSGSD